MTGKFLSIWQRYNRASLKTRYKNILESLLNRMSRNETVMTLKSTI